MKKAPQLIHTEGFSAIGGYWSAQCRLPDGRWVMARPIGYFSLRSRLKLAWGVFTGKYDALQWEGGQ